MNLISKHCKQENPFPISDEEFHNKNYVKYVHIPALVGKQTFVKKLQIIVYITKAYTSSGSFIKDSVIEELKDGISTLTLDKSTPDSKTNSTHHHLKKHHYLKTVNETHNNNKTQKK